MSVWVMKVTGVRNSNVSKVLSGRLCAGKPTAINLASTCEFVRVIIAGVPSPNPLLAAC